MKRLERCLGKVTKGLTNVQTQHRFEIYFLPTIETSAHLLILSRAQKKIKWIPQIREKSDTKQRMRVYQILQGAFSELRVSLLRVKLEPQDCHSFQF